MGLELHRRFHFVDVVCSGEADVSFPALIRALRDHDSGAIPGIRGVVHRIGGRSRSTGSAVVVPDLDTLPAPDFAEYFGNCERQATRTSSCPRWRWSSPAVAGGPRRARVRFAASMGAGPRTGPNHHIVSSPSRGSSPLPTTRPTSSSSTWSSRPVSSPGCCPSWPTNLCRSRSSSRSARRCHERILDLARQARIELQCGIESLSDTILARTNKGTTSLENLRFLKWCRASGLEPSWPMLCGFPRESEGDYAATWDLLRSVRFLPPPSELGPVLVPRFSPYFAQPALYGLHRLRPLTPYRHLYPFPAASLSPDRPVLH